MKFLLKLKHWQLFLITWGLPLAINIYSFSDPMIMFRLFPVMMIVFTIGIFGWVWAIATALHEQLPSRTGLKVGQFKILFSLPIIYIIFIALSLNYQSFSGISGEGQSIGLALLPFIIVVHILSMIFVFLGLRFAAKTMKSVELGRLAKFGDYAGEFFLIWFSPIGIWLLQPRLNKLVTGK